MPPRSTSPISVRRRTLLAILIGAVGCLDVACGLGSSTANIDALRRDEVWSSLPAGATRQSYTVEDQCELSSDQKKVIVRNQIAPGSAREAVRYYADVLERSGWTVANETEQQVHAAKETEDGQTAIALMAFSNMPGEIVEIRGYAYDSC